MNHQVEQSATIRENIAANLAALEDKISAACRAANRPRSEVELLAVSKGHPSQAIVQAVSLGLHLFGENRVQEFLTKSIELSVSRVPGQTPTVRSQIRAHLIGHLQSNKVAKAVEIFDAVDSVDSLKLAERLNATAAESGLPASRLPILLEIKLSHEASKTGLAPESHELEDLLERLHSLPHLHLQGLMTIAPFDLPEEETRSCFRALRTLRDQLARRHPKLDFSVLSMGMSGDFVPAIAEGSTRIRIGTALFGPRNYSE